MNWVKTILEPTRIPLHLGFLWDTLWKTIALLEDKTTWVEAWAKKLLTINKTTQENFEYFVGTLISTTPTVWKAPLHYRALQRLLIISLKRGRNKSKSVQISHPSIVRELEWWASGGLRANRISPWRPPNPTLHIWSNTSMHAGGAHTDRGLHFQCTRAEQEVGKQINWLKLRAAWYNLLQ